MIQLLNGGFQKFEGGDLVKECALGTEIQCQLIFIRCLVRGIQVDDLWLRKGKQAAGAVIFSCTVGMRIAVLKYTENDIFILGHLGLHMIAVAFVDGEDGVGEDALQLFVLKFRPVIVNSAFRRIICTKQTVDQIDHSGGRKCQYFFEDFVIDLIDCGSHRYAPFLK